ncbi:MAG: diaminohydroxyphosphoribosylaminopyrimidine deaminase, partial [Actinomycetota bacterium]|nr:diaminohydroxyphosphoribosylaminopyrimidine deaminase [Actinomycetota bacterium]
MPGTCRGESGWKKRAMNARSAAGLWAGMRHVPCMSRGVEVGTQDRDEVFMRRALEVAARPAFTSPNPRVGAVVVKDGTILSEGAHQGA